MNRIAVFILFAITALALSSVVLLAYPASIKCPIDGDYMFFDHKVGYGQDSVCWYSHMATVQNPGGQGVSRVKHEAYISCPD